MGSLGEAVLDLAAEGSGLEKDISAARGKALDILGGLSNMGGMIVKAGLAVATTAAVALGGALYSSVQAAADAQLVQAQLNSVLESTNGVAGVTAEQVNQLADSLSQMTMFDDEAIISAESLLLTFTNIGSDVFPQATETILDMSQALGQDLKSSTIQLGKALQDPIMGVSALRKVGVNFTEEQQKMIESLVESGRLEEAQALILKELQAEFGGSAKAAGETFAGKLKILQTNLGNIQETIGGALLPVLSDFLGMLSDYLARPEMQAMLARLAEQLGNFARRALESLPRVIQMFGDFVNWMKNNKGVLVGVFAALTAAVLAFAYTSLVPLLPVIAVMALIGLAAYVLYQAWTQNWGGIQEKLAAVWAWLQPLLMRLWTWLQVNVPLALQALANFWNTVLLPAIQNVWAWINANIMPLLAALWAWLSVNIPLAIQTLSNFWSGTLLPAIMAVWSWMSGTLLPFFQSINNFITAVFVAGLRILAAVWKSTLQPAIMAVWNVINTNLMPIIKKLHEFFNANILPVLKTVGGYVSGAFTSAFRTLTSIIQGVTDALNLMADALINVELPDDLTPGSPTPFEIGLWGIHEALTSLNRMSLPTLSTQMQMSSAAFAGRGYVYAGAGAQPAANSGHTFYAPVTFEVKDADSFDNLMRTLRTA